MAKVFNKILGFIGLEPDLEEEYENEEELDQAEGYGYANVRQQAPAQPINFEEYSGPTAAPRRNNSRPTHSRDNKVVSMYKNNGGNNLIIFKPASCEDSSHMIDCLKSNRPVIANFENIDHTKAQRILDMMSGAMYAMCGTVNKVSASIYLFAPEGTDVSGDGKENNRNNSVSNLYDVLK